MLQVTQSSGTELMGTLHIVRLPEATSSSIRSGYKPSYLILMGLQTDCPPVEEDSGTLERSACMNTLTKRYECGLGHPG